MADESGTAQIKQEFLIQNHSPVLSLNFVTEEDKALLSAESVEASVSTSFSRQKRRKNNVLKGQNKKRGPTFTESDEARLCYCLVDIDVSLADIPQCTLENCKFIHSIDEYLKTKGDDLGECCYIYSVRGHCPYGIKCRFGKSHLTQELRNKKNVSQLEEYEKCSFKNFLSKEVQHNLRKRKYIFSRSERVISQYDISRKKEKECSNAVSESDLNESQDNTEDRIGYCDDTDLIHLRVKERKKVNWSNKLYLAPLTTVGNLPFRRICKEFGADITCGEMAMASSLLQGSQQEWALVRRHHSEDLFGMQVCGNNPHIVTKCAQLLQEQTDIDFLDINLGCPLDHVYQMGAGSGLMGRKNVLESVIHCANTVLDIPLTVKCRSGIYKEEKVAHKLMPLFSKHRVSLVTVHGRTKDQRYSKSADWAYVEQCAELAKPVPVFGNGDILSFEDYNKAKTSCPVLAGVMIGRGALYKPWLFTEIKEQRHWDISSTERFDLLKKYVNYGLEHWGTDTKGVETTRRFLLEWLSFFHRYIPVGLLESPPQKINQRPPAFRGRDDLETLLSSANCNDWIKISEMLLGPVPEGFNFLPKHKASSWK